MDNQPKISGVEAFLLISVTLIIDIVPIILIFFGLPDFFIPGLLGLATLFYLKMKGISLVRDLIASIGELIPYVSALPLKTAGMILTIWIDWHPQGALAKAAEKATQAIKIKRGVKGARPGAAVPGVKSPIGAIPAPSATQATVTDFAAAKARFAKAPTEGV
jgi:hypothetical protein